MKNLKTESLKSFSEEQWQKYSDMMQEVRRKYYPGTYDPDHTAKDTKDMWFTYYETYKPKLFEQHAIFSDDVPVGWVGYMLDNRSASFNFEADYDTFPADIMKVIISKVFEFIKENNLNDVYHWTFESRKIAWLKGINAPVSEEMINTRINRSEMNADFYNSIISSCDITNFRLVYCEELPVELWDNYTGLMNDILDDYWALHPVKQPRKRMEKQDWQLRDKSEKLSGAKMQMYILLTTENEIAAYCSLYIDSNNKETIRHSGGFTAVARSHRGKGFAAYLKAKMYLKLLEENHDFTNIETDTMPWNTYMYRINERFGFKPHSYGSEFRLTKEFINNYLNL